MCAQSIVYVFMNLANAVLWRCEPASARVNSRPGATGSTYLPLSSPSSSAAMLTATKRQAISTAPTACTVCQARFEEDRIGLSVPRSPGGRQARCSPCRSTPADAEDTRAALVESSLPTPEEFLGDAQMRHAAGVALQSAIRQGTVDFNS